MTLKEKDAIARQNGYTEEELKSLLKTAYFKKFLAIFGIVNDDKKFINERIKKYKLLLQKKRKGK